jgi:aminoglycoside phosphotransferase family enzyme
MNKNGSNVNRNRGLLLRKKRRGKKIDECHGNLLIGLTPKAAGSKTQLVLINFNNKSKIIDHRTRGKT